MLVRSTHVHGTWALGRRTESHGHLSSILQVGAPQAVVPGPARRPGRGVTARAFPVPSIRRARAYEYSYEVADIRPCRAAILTRPARQLDRTGPGVPATRATRGQRDEPCMRHESWHPGRPDPAAGTCDRALLWLNLQPARPETTLIGASSGHCLVVTGASGIEPWRAGTRTGRWTPDGPQKEMLSVASWLSEACTTCWNTACGARGPLQDRSGPEHDPSIVTIRARSSLPGKVAMVVFLSFLLSGQYALPCAARCAWPRLWTHEAPCSYYTFPYEYLVRTSPAGPDSVRRAKSPHRFPPG